MSFCDLAFGAEGRSAVNETALEFMLPKPPTLQAAVRAWRPAFLVAPYEPVLSTPPASVSPAAMLVVTPEQASWTVAEDKMPLLTSSGGVPTTLLAAEETPLPKQPVCTLGPFLPVDSRC